MIAQFAKDLEAAIRAEVREQLIAAIEAGVGTPRSGKAASKARDVPTDKVDAKRAAGPKKRVRRSAEDLAEIQRRITDLLAQGGKLTSEEIQEQLGLDKEAIQRPLQLLRESSEVKTTGEKRSMRYFVGTGKAGVLRRTKGEAAE